MATSKKAPSIEGAVSAAEALRFAAVADEIMRVPLPATRRRDTSGESEGVPHIGTLREKRLHAAVKTYLCPDVTCHERPIEAEGATRRTVADILWGGEILEVQTGGFYPLRDKITWYLENTSYRVTVVHPLGAVRYLSWIDPGDGHILSRRRVARRGRVRDVARELYWLSDFIGNPRFSLRILLLELEEYRMADGWSRDGKRGSSRYERFPTALLGDVTLATPTDYTAYFMPVALTAAAADGLCPSFTATEFSQLSGIRGKAVYSLIHLFERLGVVDELAEKVGRSKVYRCRGLVSSNISHSQI